VPKLITVHHPEQISQQAREYVRTRILFPSGIVGLFCLVGAVGGLGYQLIASDSYTWTTFYFSSGLIALGIMLGTAQTSYHRYLYRRFPGVLAARLRWGPAGPRGKTKREAPSLSIEHSGRRLIPGAYLAGVALLVGSSVVSITYGHVDAVPAFLMPWAGFYWAKLFVWRRVIL
jgi:hypothetical protein